MHDDESGPPKEELEEERPDERASDADKAKKKEWEMKQQTNTQAESGTKATQNQEKQHHLEDRQER